MLHLNIKCAVARVKIRHWQSKINFTKIPSAGESFVPIKLNSDDIVNLLDVCKQFREERREHWEYDERRADAEIKARLDYATGLDIDELERPEGYDYDECPTRFKS